LPGVFFENLLFQIDMIRLDVRSSCTSELNSRMQRMTHKIFAELSRAIPRSLNWRHSKLI
jgi:hypothetical protein